jgi:hypothetical protein
VKLILPKPHPKQHELINAFELIKGIRFVVGACGTKFGKTYGCTIRLVKEAWENKNSLNWWVAPTYDQAKMAYGLVKRLLPKDTFIEKVADLKIILLEPDGAEHSVIQFRSADNESSLRGYAVNFCIIDEASRISFESFVSVMTTLTHTRGRAIIISTPKGRGWFYDIYQRGEKLNADGTPRFSADNPDPFPEWIAIRMPTSANPTVPRQSIEEARRNLPEDVFAQEYLAVFQLQSAGVFKNIRGCIKGTLERPIPGRQYVMGVDLARLRDFSVIIVMDKLRKHVVYFEKFNQISWEVQYHRIIRVARQYYSPSVSIDSTGIGDPIVETLRNAGVRVEPYKIGSSAAKQQLIEKLRVCIEQGRISYPKIFDILLELESYEYKMTEGNVVKYSAPPGKHDDCVIALALAVLLVDQERWVYRHYSVRGV